MTAHNSRSGSRNSPAETVVLTATFTPSETPFVAIADPLERKFQYFSALLCWLRDPCVANVIFCENSGTSYDFSRFLNLASLQGKRLEVLVLNGNAESSQLGKGFGEGMILEHVMRQSSILRSCTSFFKCTGRVYVSNFSEISDFLNDTEEGFFPLDMTYSIANQALPRLTVNNAWKQVFVRSQKAAAFSRKAGRWIWNPRLIKGCDTRFFKTGSDFFRQRLMNQYRTVDDRAGYYLEHAYYYGLEGRIEFLSGTTPVFTGMSGTSGYGLDASFPEAIMAEALGFL